MGIAGRDAAEKGRTGGPSPEDMEKLE